MNGTARIDSRLSGRIEPMDGRQISVNFQLVGHSEVIQFDGLSAFRPCGSDLVEFFNSTVWAFYVKLT